MRDRWKHGFPPVINRIPWAHDHPNDARMRGSVVIPKVGLMFLYYFWFGPGTEEHDLKAKGALWRGVSPARARRVCQSNDMLLEEFRRYLEELQCIQSAVEDGGFPLSNPNFGRARSH